MTFQDYWRIFRRRWYIVALTTVTCVVCISVYTKVFLTPRYMSSARVEVTRPVLSEGGDQWLYYTGHPIDNAIKQITSRACVEETLRRLGDIDDETAEEEVEARVQDIRGRLTASGIPNTNVVEIRMEGTDPVEIRRVATAVAETFEALDEEWERRDEEAAINFIDMRMSQVRESLEEAEMALIAFKSEHPSLVFSPEAESKLQTRTTLEADIAELDEEIAAEESRLDLIDEGGANVDLLVSMDPQLTELEGRKTELVNERNELLTRYTERHPDYARLTDAIDEIDRQIAVRYDEARNTTRETVMERIGRLNARKAEIRRRINEIWAEIAELPSEQITMARLELEVEVNRNLYRMFVQNREERELARASHVSSIRSLGDASEARQIYPNERANQTMGLAFGLLMGFAFTLLLESLDTSIRTIEEIETFMGVPVLGVIPTVPYRGDEDGEFGLPSEMAAAGVIHHHPRDPASEAYRALATTLEFKFFGEGERALLVASSTPQEGKTTTTCNLALALAKAGKHTLVVDANLRHPGVSRYFGLDEHHGLADVLKEELPWKGAVFPSAVDFLDVMPTGHIPSEPVELLKRRLAGFLKEATPRYDAIIFDSPPILPVTDGCVVAALCGGTILVYSQGRAPREVLVRARTRLESANGKVVGMVLNNVRPEGELGRDYYYYYYNYYPR